MKYIIKIFFVLLLISGLSACQKTLNGLLDNPNYPSLSTADVDLYLNQIQLSFNSLWSTASDYGAQLTRQQSWTGPFYYNGYTPASFDAEWTSAYTGVVANVDAMLPLAVAQKKYTQVGIAYTLKAFSYGILVDDFGDVPYSEADLGIKNTTPKVDPGASVYAGIQILLDSALAAFQNPDNAPDNNMQDLFYHGNTSNWVSLVKTLKLKFYMQTRLVDNTAAANIQALLTENNLINSAAQDFQFSYGTNYTSPDNRHPHYGLDYVNSGGVGEYLGNYFMWMVACQKYGGGSVNFSGDPRLRYYFYRQAVNYSWADQQSCPCSVNLNNSQYPAWYPPVPTSTPYCLIGKGYMGRDHGDNSGAPPDGSYRTGFGLYPAGGQFDASQGAAVSLGLGAGGAGISPIWLSSYTSFLEAEAVLTLGVAAAGSPRSLMLNGVSASISKVLGFGSTINYTVPAGYIPPGSQISSYDSLVGSNYDTASSDDSRLNIIMTEYYISLWGSGVECYNNYRRTGKPNNMQPAVAVPAPGLFMRSFYYPSVFVNRNSNAPAQKNGNLANKVFWDNNPDNFIQ
jgi:Starch-binding associating with outer membrane/Susd and RagB outer membrane lipoprotein